VVFVLTSITSTDIHTIISHFHRLAFVGYPFFCNRPGSEVQCIRGGKAIAKILTLSALSIPLLSIIYVSITMFRVFRKVRDVEVNARRYSFIALHRGYDKKKTTKISRRVMIQGILYSVAMILTWIFNVANIIIFFASSQTAENSRVIRYFAIIFNPLQGMFNFLIYLMPSARKIMKERRRQSSLALKEDSQEKNEDQTDKKNLMFPYELPSPLPKKTPNRVSFNDECAWNLPGNDNLDCNEEEKEEEKKETESFSLSRFSTNNNNENDLDIGKHLHVNQNNNENDNNSYYNDNGQC